MGFLRSRRPGFGEAFLVRGYRLDFYRDQSGGGCNAHSREHPRDILGVRSSAQTDVEDSVLDDTGSAGAAYGPLNVANGIGQQLNRRFDWATLGEEATVREPGFQHLKRTIRFISQLPNCD
jgi:hypothetical protein